MAIRPNLSGRMLQAWEAGYQAGFSSPVYSCPYLPGSAERVSFLSGHYVGSVEREKSQQGALA